MHAAGAETCFYTILGVDRGAGPATVRDQYRRLMQNHHPDVGGDTNSAALINKAYAVLSDPVLRAEYDTRLFILERVAEGFSVAPETSYRSACFFCAQPHGYIPQNHLEDVGCARCGSALQVARNQRMEPSGQRAVMRFGRTLELSLFTDHRQVRGVAAKTEDVSLNGVRLRSRCGLKRGQRVRMVSSIFDAVGEVVHCVAHTGWRAKTVAGVAFLTLRFARPAGVFVSRQI